MSYYTYWDEAPRHVGPASLLIITRVLMLVGHRYRRKWNPSDMEQTVRNVQNFCLSLGVRNPKPERALSLVTPYSGFLTSSEPSSVKYPGRRGTHKWSGTGALHPVLNKFANVTDR